MTGGQHAVPPNHAPHEALIEESLAESRLCRFRDALGELLKDSAIYGPPNRSSMNVPWSVIWTPTAWRTRFFFAIPVR